MVTKLGKWTLDTKKWQEENKLTSPEWVMFVQNRKNMIYAVAMLYFTLGMICATYIAAIN